MASSNIDLYVDESYLLTLLNDEPIPVSDEKYAQELLLQEVLISSSSNSPIPQTHYSNQTSTIPKVLIFSSSNPQTHSSNQTSEIPEEDGKQSIPENAGKEKRPKSEHDETTQLEEKGESSNSNLIFCGICMDYKQTHEIFKGLIHCNHEFCTDCIVRYVVSKIKENIARVECPDPKCKQTIEPQNCSSIIPKEVFSRWENSLCESMILGWQKFYCPYKDCSVLMVDDGDEVTSSECPSCNRLFCAKCQVRWHEGVTCEEFQKLGENEREKEDIMVMNLAKDQKWRRCSSCRVYVEKIDGCLHMTCRCHYEFCYQCGGQWSNTHQCLSMD